MFNACLVGCFVLAILLIIILLSSIRRLRRRGAINGNIGYIVNAQPGTKLELFDLNLEDYDEYRWQLKGYHGIEFTYCSENKTMTICKS